ncbi:hypothetical protein UPYG_G00122990 [Umbra pygmaea]|uniref:Beta/gamma crystallin 'Greek key' domain-containing protein n=1 Tax=Umbra pygmaea TaxID=75934 RepID=A0ABD0X5F7_UMBPY
MSSFKRQSSWQEDIARNFSRLFQRAKSQDPEKTEENVIISSGQENGVLSSSGGEQSQHQKDLDMSQAFQGTKEERNRKDEGVLEEALEDEATRGQENGGEGSSAVSYQAGGSSENQPLGPPLSAGSPATPPGPGSPTPPPPLDAFLKRLGSLFHFKAEPAQAVQQQGDPQQAREVGEGQEEETALVANEAEPSGTTCGAEGHCDSAGRLPETDASREEDSDLLSVATSTHANRDTLEKPAVEEVQNEGPRSGCAEGSPGADSGLWRDAEAVVDEHQRRLALASPPVVTYGTYRGQRDRRKMSRRLPVEMDAPISEGKEALHGMPSAGVTPCTSEHAVLKQSDIQTTSTNQVISPASKIHDRGLWTLEMDSVVLGPTEHGSSNIPFTTQAAEGSGCPSAFPLSREENLASNGGQPKDAVSGVGSVTGPPSMPTKDSADDRTGAAVSGGQWGDQSLQDDLPGGEMDPDRDMRLREQPETSHCVQTGSPSEAVTAWLSETPSAGGVAAHHTHLPAAVSGCNPGQLAPHPISLSESLASAAQSQGAVPTSRHSQDPLESGPGSGMDFFESGRPGGDVMPSDHPLEDSLHLDSTVMVNHILRNAVSALKRIGSSEEDNDIQEARGDADLGRPITGEEGGVDCSFRPDKLVETVPSKREEDRHPSDIPAEQTLSLNPKPLSEGPKSTPSSGYESIAGSDTDIRSSPGPAWENSIPTSIISDHRHDEHCTEETLGTGNLIHVKGQQLVDANDLLREDKCSPSNDNTSCKYSGHQHQRDGLPCFSGGVSFQKPCLHGDSGDNIQILRVSHECQLVSGKRNENKGEVLCISGDSGNTDMLGVQETQLRNRLVHIAKDIESNTHNPKLDSCAQFSNVFMSNNYNESHNDKTFLRNQTALFEPDLVTKDSKHETKGNTESDFKSVRPKHNQNPQIRQVASPKRIACVTLHDNDQGGCPDITLTDPQSESRGLVEMSVCPGGEEKGDHSRLTGPTSMEPSGRPPKDLRPAEVLVCDSGFASSNEHRPQKSSVRVYRCDISPQQDTLGHGGAASAMAGFHQDLSSRLAGLHAAGPAGGRRPPSLEPLLPLLPVPQLAFHDMETSCFSIIDEEEEMDAVFVNDTGPMLSPTARRAKAYPFSLSPIVEEDGLRGDEVAEGGLSRDDRGLMVPPATEEELRSLSGGVGGEQQASSSSLSILTLLQSVSERLQSSGYSDMDAEPEQTPSPALRGPLWDFFNRGHGEVGEGDVQGVDGDQSSTQEGPGPLTPPTDPFCMRPGEGEPTEDRNTLSSPGMTDQEPAESPKCHYLYSVQPMLHDDVNSQQTDELVPCLRDNTCPSTATDTGENCYGQYGKVIPRPTMIHIYDDVEFSGEKLELYTDQEDSAMVFPHGASVRVLGGCWLLYLEPGFQGPGVLMEEGETVLTHQPGSQGTEDKPTKITIGSIRRLVKDDRTPVIHVLSAGMQGEASEHLHSEVDNLGTRGAPVDLVNLTVKSGSWVAYDSPGYHGSYVIMEVGGSTTPAAGHNQVTTVRSLRPLRMSGLTVRRPLDPKMLVFEQSLFSGQVRELGGHTPSLGAVSGLTGASSLQVIAGIWVGYTQEHYTGQQYLLEEGHYSDCAELGGADHPLLLSFRFLQADFVEPSMSMQEETDTPEGGKTDILDLDIPNLEEAGATEKTTSLFVKNGVWVAYSEPCFTGEQCILEKGNHPAILPWGGSHGPAKSIRPIRLDLCGTEEPKHLLRVYSLPHYRGVSEEFEGETGHCEFATPMSFRVIRGSWRLFDEEGFCGNEYILQEGLYPDLISCGCMATSVKSLKPIPYIFSDPSISLFSLGSFEGLKMVSETPTEHMEDFFSQSLRVESGLWMVYEYSNYRGRQMLLQPGEIPLWAGHSGWDTIGSLRPFKQPRVYVQVRNRALGLVLTSETVQDGSSPARASLSSPCSLDTQRWLFIGGLLRCKASKVCLSVIGAKARVGARVALWPEHRRTHQRWSLNHNGTISSHLNHKLVLDFRGGTGFERDHLVVNEFSTDQATQFWDIQMV